MRMVWPDTPRRQYRASLRRSTRRSISPGQPRMPCAKACCSRWRGACRVSVKLDRLVMVSRHEQVRCGAEHSRADWVQRGHHRTTSSCRKLANRRLRFARIMGDGTIPRLSLLSISTLTRTMIELPSRDITGGGEVALGSCVVCIMAVTAQDATGRCVESIFRE